MKSSMRGLKKVLSKKSVEGPTTDLNTISKSEKVDEEQDIEVIVNLKKIRMKPSAFKDGLSNVSSLKNDLESVSKTKKQSRLSRTLSWKATKKAKKKMRGSVISIESVDALSDLDSTRSERLDDDLEKLCCLDDLRSIQPVEETDREEAKEEGVKVCTLIIDKLQTPLIKENKLHELDEQAVLMTDSTATLTEAETPASLSYPFPSNSSPSSVGNENRNDEIEQETPVNRVLLFSKEEEIANNELRKIQVYTAYSNSHLPELESPKPIEYTELTSFKNENLDIFSPNTQEKHDENCACACAIC